MHFSVSGMWFVSSWIYYVVSKGLRKLALSSQVETQEVKIFPPGDLASLIWKYTSKSRKVLRHICLKILRSAAETSKNVVTLYCRQQGNRGRRTPNKFQCFIFVDAFFRSISVTLKIKHVYIKLSPFCGVCLNCYSLV